uniref:Glutathione S-transferase n=1 Tax=Hanusia phi TaxID=3032 RepID=A0A7S0EYZ1_9CRYP
MPVKLTYFNLRGLAEPTRYMLHIAGVEYEDHRYPIDVAAGFKRPEFDADQAKGVFDMNMGRIPLLEVDGQVIGQSRPIARFVARKYGFMGDNDIEAAQVDAAFEHVKDIVDAYQKPRSITDEAAKKEAIDKWFSTELPTWYGKLEKSIALTSKKDGCSVGSKISLADIGIYYLAIFFFDDKELNKAAWEKHPKVKAVVEAVANHPKVKEWEAKRPNTVM